jgi:uncharacterized protein (DUF58 family)
VTRTASPKLAGYAGLAALALVAALVLGRPELAAIAAPFVVVLGVGLVLAGRPELRIESSLQRERALEGEEVVLRLRISASEPVGRLDLRLGLPPGIELAEGKRSRCLRVRDERELELPLRCVRWGGYRIGDVTFVARDPVGLFATRSSHRGTAPLKVYPRAETLQRLLVPVKTQASSGNHVARAKGEGIEFADLRPWAPGDRVRRINWRASARRTHLVVNESHPERNADVVVFLDTFSETRAGASGTLDLAVRAAASVVARALRHRDRVGLVSFGGFLNWLLPASGLVQQYRIVDALVDTRLTLSYAWKDIDVLPLRTLPPHALIVALSPLLDERATGALLDLRARGFDLVVVEVSPLPFVAAPRGELGRTAHRLWLLRREALRGRYEQAGVPVVEWTSGEALGAAFEEVRTYRRYAGSLRG